MTNRVGSMVSLPFGAVWRPGPVNHNNPDQVGFGRFTPLSGGNLVTPHQMGIVLQLLANEHVHEFFVPNRVIIHWSYSLHGF